MSRQFRSMMLILFTLGFALMFSSWHHALSASASPRDNPKFWDMLSSVVVIDPARSYLTQFQAFARPGSFNNLLNILADIPLGPNVLCNQDQTTQAQNEPSIDVNPFNSNHIIATSNDYRLLAAPSPGHDVRTGYYVSFDGGNTWPGDGIIDISGIPNTSAAGDPAIAIHDIHNVYYSYIVFSRSTIAGGVAVSKSTDGGLTWLAPVIVAWNSASEFQDKDYLTVDATGSIYDGNVYITWTRFGNGAPIYFSRSTDGGATFSIPIQISDPGNNSNQGSLPVVGLGGVIYVAWFNYDTSGIRMVKSINGGQSFGTPFAVADVNEIPSPLPGGGFRDNSFPTTAVNKDNGDIYVAWSDYLNGDADIYLTRSTSGGSTWSEPVRINDDPLGNDAHQFFPWMDFAPNGNLYIGWYDSRLDPTPLVQPLLYDEYVSVSTDGGLTFSLNQRMSEVTADSSIGSFSTPFIGDYSGLAAINDFIYPAWVDTRRSQEDIFSQRVNPVKGQKTAPASVSPHAPFTYVITLNSIVKVPDNHISDPIPTDTTFVPGSAWASSGTINYSYGEVTWEGDIAISNPITITFDVTPTVAACIPITNTALLTTGEELTTELSATSVITNPPPAPEFSWVSSELVFTFTNKTPSTFPLNYVWDFGDSITSTEISPVHDYALPGEYTVSLTAAGLCGSAEISHPITAACSPPQAGFSWLNQDLSVTFTNLSSGIQPLAYQWDFGDGSMSTDLSPTHIYTSLGRYPVHLTVTGPCGKSDYETTVALGQFIFLPLTFRQ
jgi:PKD repeat protein